MLAERDRQREGTAQAWQHGFHRLLGRGTVLDLARDQVGHDLAIGVAFERAPVRQQLVAQRLEVLDDAIVDQRHLGGGVGVGVVCGRRAVGRPAGVGDADRAGRGIALQLAHQVGELALRAPPHQRAAIQRAYARAVIAAVFHSPQAVDQPIRDLFPPDDADNAAHRMPVL
jgi:hypothetical protein